MSAAGDGELEYVGFWLRAWAALIDTACLLLVLWPLAAVLERQGAPTLDQLLADPAGLSADSLLAQVVPGTGDLLLWGLLPAILVLAFWDRKFATPGKMAIHARIVDAASRGPPTRRQLLLRYLGYFLAMLPLGLGLLWVGFDPRKQGWHDKLAGTVVVRRRRRA